MSFMQSLAGTPWIYVAILFGKIIEVSISTIRVVLITRGERKVGTVLAFIEIVLWVAIVSGVLTNISEDPLKAFVYALGFAIGTYVGSVIEGKIGMGTSQIQIIVKDEHGDSVAAFLREQGCGVTTVEAQGKTSARKILYAIVPRRNIRHIIKKTMEFQSDSVISVIDTKPLHGVFGVKK